MTSEELENEIEVLHKVCLREAGYQWNIPSEFLKAWSSHRLEEEDVHNYELMLYVTVGRIVPLRFPITLGLEKWLSASSTHRNPSNHAYLNSEI